MIDTSLEPIETRQAYEHLLSMVQDPRITEEAIIDQVCTMPVLAAQLLRAANQSAISGDMPIDRFDRAVILLERDDLADLIEALLERCDDTLLVGPFRKESLRLHAFVVSKAAMLVAEAAHLPLAREAQAAAMLHDIGILDQLSHFPEQFQAALTAARNSRSRLVDNEGLLCGRDHCEAGEKLLRRFGLPDSITNAVAYHHDPLAAPQRHRYLAVLIYAAECLARRAGFRDLSGDEELALETRVLAELRLDDPSLRAWVHILRQQVRSRAMPVTTRRDDS